MSNIKQAFANGKAFIPFITCGDPDLATTAACVRALAEAGADLIELGIPFSDPTAEGPVIMAANERALAGGVTTDDIFELVRVLRSGEAVAGAGAVAEVQPQSQTQMGVSFVPVTVPMVFMTYANVVYHYGIEEFCSRAAEVGIDGLILPDVPFEEKGEFAPICAAHGMDLVSMIAPTSEDRIAMIAREAAGFVYCVSSLGVTGTRTSITTDIGAIVTRVRSVTDTPVAVGFGISNPEQAAAMAAKSDGAIMGSAIVKIVAAEGTNASPKVTEFARAVKEALRQVS